MDEVWTLNEGQIAEVPRSKTSLRMHYEAQVEVLKKQVGDLEDIRSRLDLTQRKISQLLMIDPSSWTRWIKGGDQAPPHIYRALNWYLILQEKIPGLTPQYFIGKDPGVLHQAALREIRLESEARKRFEVEVEGLLKQKEGLETKIQGLERQVQATRAGFFLLVLALLIMGGVVLFKLRG
jgi:transcriptional regulator with XRE-family HTH domain